jgi:hypothetical protein
MALAINNLTSKSNSNSIPSYTVGSETGRILIVALGMSFAQDNATIGVTYGGVALTKAGSATSPLPDEFVRAELWYLLNPTAGAATIAVTSDDNTEMPVIVGYISGADTTGVGATGSNNGTSTNANVDVTPTASGNLLLGVHKTGISGATAFAAGTGTTLSRQQTNADGTVGLSSRTSAGTSPTNLSLTATSDGWAAFAVEIKAAGGAPPPTNKGTTRLMMGV